MQTKDNQITPQIYYRPLHQWLKVTPEQKQEWERFVGTIRKSQQRANACCIPYKKSYKCDGVCEGCEFRHIPENAPQCLSIESEMEYECSSGTRDSFLTDNALITEISIDSMFLRHLLTELQESDPESHQILMVLAEGFSERAGAEQLHMPRNTFVYKKNQLLKRIRKNF